MKTRSLISKLYSYYPKSIAEYYEDYVGLMVGKFKEDTKKILLCLDFDETIFLETLEYRPDLIITHHPFFYGLKSEILKEDKHKADLYKMLNKYELTIFSLHTNFDGGNPGMNDALAKALDLKDIYGIEDDYCIRIGTLEKEMKIDEFAQYVKQKFNIPYAMLLNYGSKKIKKVGIVGGGGSSDFKLAQKEGCDIYISGDVPHYIRRDIVINKMNYLDVPHEVERIFMPTLKEVLLDIDPSLDIKIIDHEKLPKIV